MFLSLICKVVHKPFRPLFQFRNLLLLNYLIARRSSPPHHKTTGMQAHPKKESWLNSTDTGWNWFIAMFSSVFVVLVLQFRSFGCGICKPVKRTRSVKCFDPLPKACCTWLLHVRKIDAYCYVSDWALRNTYLHVSFMIKRSCSSSLN